MKKRTENKEKVHGVSLPRFGLLILSTTLVRLKSSAFRKVLSSLSPSLSLLLFISFPSVYSVPSFFFFPVGTAPVCFQPFWGLAVLVTNCLNGVVLLSLSLSPSLTCSLARSRAMLSPGFV